MVGDIEFRNQNGTVGIVMRNRAGDIAIDREARIPRWLFEMWQTTLASRCVILYEDTDERKRFIVDIQE
jgi:hypothetical protein